jgi:hypothetical protein
MISSDYQFSSFGFVSSFIDLIIITIIGSLVLSHIDLLPDESKENFILGQFSCFKPQYLSIVMPEIILLSCDSLACFEYIESEIRKI